MLLFPDMSKTQHEADHFVYAAPCTTSEWYQLMQKAKTRVQPTDVKKDFLNYVYVMEDEENICLIMRPNTATDDDCLGTAAYIRMVDEFNGMIYALPSTADTNEGQSMAVIIARTSGVPPHQVRHVEI